MQDASARLTVLGSRIADRQLADDLAAWQHAMSLETQRVVRGEGARTPEQVQEMHPRFIDLTDRLGCDFDG